MSARDWAAVLLTAVTLGSVAGTYAAFRTWFRYAQMGGAVVFLLGPSVVGLLYSAVGWGLLAAGVIR